MRKILSITRNIAAVVMILLGCVGFWSRHTATGTLFLFAGICTLQSFWDLLRLKVPMLRAVLPIFLIGAGIGCLFIPKETVQTAFSVKKQEQINVYITSAGTKYHYKLSCAGDTASLTQKAAALQNGYTPCAKCAK